MSLVYPDEIQHAIAGAHDVWAALGHGHTESVYQEALLVYMRDNRCRCSSEQSVQIMYRDIVVGTARADIVGMYSVIELKVAPTLTDEHRQQLDKYMKHIPKPWGLLVNFSKRLGGGVDYVVVEPPVQPM